MKTVLWKLIRHGLMALTIVVSACGSSAQDYAVEPIAVRSVAGTSTDGNFAVRGTFSPAIAEPLTDGVFALLGTMRSVVPASPSAGPELIVNGSFENTMDSFERDGQGLMILRDGATNIPGWTVTLGEMAWIDNGNVYGAATPFGGMFLDLTGLFGPSAGLIQTIPTVPGHRYRLSLALGFNSLYSGRNAVSVCAGGANTIFVMSPAAMTGDQWQRYEFRFTADVSSSVIAIEPIATTGGYLGLDNVSVTEDPSPDSNSTVDLVVNGSFENDCSNTFVPNGHGVMALTPGSTAIPGWTTTGAEIAWGMNGNAFGSGSSFGALFLDLTGYHDAPPYGGVTQNLATEAGGHYRLTFAVGSDEDVGAYRGPMSILATVGERSESFTFNPTGEGNQWETFTMTFVATTSSTPLTLTGMSSFGGAYLGLDRVSVVADEGSNQLQLTGVASSGGGLTLSFPTVAGAHYLLETSVSLTPGGWQTLAGSERVGTGNPISISTVIDPRAPQRFIRLRRTP